MRRPTRPALAALLAGAVLAATASLPLVPAQAQAADAVDNFDRASVRALWNDVVEPALAVPTGWTGSVQGCRPGAPSAAATRAGLDVVNAVRDLSDLRRVRFDAALSASAQQAALIMDARGELSHFPPPDWPCWTQQGASSAGRSSLYLGPRSAAAAVLGYMDDPGSSNTFVGHRRYLLDAQQRTMGNGQTSRSNALTVLADDRTPDPAAPAFIGWPTAGYLPLQAEPEGRWSLSASDTSTDFGAARVSVQREDGTSLPVRQQPVVDGYGPATLVWELGTAPGAAGPDRSYRVTVTGIRQGGRTLVHTYTVRLFDARQAGPQVAVPAPVTRDAASPAPTTTPTTAPTTSPTPRPTTAPTPTPTASGQPTTGVPVPAVPARFVAIEPARLLDTRTGLGAPSTGRLAQRSTLSLQVTGRAGIPTTGVTAVVLNLTGLSSSRSSFVTAHPAGSTRPDASSLNLTPGLVAPNLTVVKTGPDGRVALYNDAGTTHLLADVAGYYTDAPSTGSAFVPVQPDRLLDTRTGLGAPSTGRLAERSTLSLQVTGRAGIPTTGVTAVVLNLTGLSSSRSSFVTAHPAGSTRPDASSLNLTPGLVAPNLTVVKTGPDGRVALYNDAGTTHLLADVAGYYTDAPSTGSAFVPVQPDRLLDTRTGLGAPSTGRLAERSTLSLQVTGRAGIPTTGVTAVVLNLTGLSSSRSSFLTAHPAGSTRPDASSLNLTPGLVAPNLTVVKTGPDGRVALYNDAGTTHLLADVAGYYTG